jgi:hypothetical protein
MPVPKKISRVDPGRGVFFADHVCNHLLAFATIGSDALVHQFSFANY